MSYLPLPLVSQLSLHLFVETIIIKTALTSNGTTGIYLLLDHVDKRIVSLLNRCLHVCRITALLFRFVRTAERTWLMPDFTDTGVKNSLEDVPEVERPAEEEFEEVFAEQKEDKFQGKLVGKSVKMIVYQKQYLGDGKYLFTFKHYLDTLQEELVVKSARNGSGVLPDRGEKAIDHLECYLHSFRLINVCLVQQNSNKDIEQFLIGY